MIINNESPDSNPVNMSISLDGDKQKQHVISSSAALQPGLQYMPGRKCKKGTYTISIGTDNDAINVKHPITLDADRWILITYSLADSANIIKNYGYLDPGLFKKINGKYASLNMYVESRRPPNL
ncbi:MAG: hypothetical protein NVSMB63_04370 [Sediminibacterium sp.]